MAETNLARARFVRVFSDLRQRCPRCHRQVRWTVHGRPILGGLVWRMARAGLLKLSCCCVVDGSGTSKQCGCPRPTYPRGGL